MAGDDAAPGAAAEAGAPDADAAAIEAAPPEPPALAAALPPERISLASWLTSALFVCLLAGVYSQQNLLGPNLTAVAADFGFTPAERDQKLGGTVSVAVFVTAGCCALLAGVLCDALPRRPLLVFFVCLSMSACLGTAFVKTFYQLLPLRAVSGIALGCVPPLVYAGLADIFPPSRRNLAASFVTVATSAGLLVGQVIAGYIGPVDGWRRPFILVSVPCLFLALLVPFAREPSRGGAEPALRVRVAAAAAAARASLTAAAAAPPGSLAATPPPTPRVEYAERLDVRKLAAVFAVPTNVAIFAQCIPSCVPWGVLNAFIIDFVAQDRGMGIRVATGALLVYSAGGLLGSFGGAALTQRLFNRRPALVGVVVAISTAAGIGPMLYIVRGAYGPGRFGPLAGAAFGAGVLTCVAAPALRAALLIVNTPETRGSAFAVYVFLDALGKGLGPLGAASLSVKQGRVRAFTSAIALWAISAGLQLLLVGTLRRDERSLHVRLSCAKLHGLHGVVTTEVDRAAEAAEAGAARQPTALSAAQGHGASTLALLAQEEEGNGTAR